MPRADNPLTQLVSMNGFQYVIDSRKWIKVIFCVIFRRLNVMIRFIFFSFSQSYANGNCGKITDEKKKCAAETFIWIDYVNFWSDFRRIKTMILDIPFEMLIAHLLFFFLQTRKKDEKIFNTEHHHQMQENEDFDDHALYTWLVACHSLYNLLINMLKWSVIQMVGERNDGYDAFEQFQWVE